MSSWLDKICARYVFHALLSCSGRTCYRDAKPPAATLVCDIVLLWPTGILGTIGYQLPFFKHPNTIWIQLQGNASTLTRGEVRGGGAKPYKQKGTGNARIGTKRTPLRPGGGITFGPKPRDWSITMNKKEKRLALATAIQSAADDMIVVEDFASQITEVKTKNLLAQLEAVGANPMEEKTLLILNEPSENVYLSGRNMEFLAINIANAVQVYDVLGASKVVVEKSALEYINEYYGDSN